MDLPNNQTTTAVAKHPTTVDSEWIREAMGPGFQAHLLSDIFLQLLGYPRAG